VLNNVNEVEDIEKFGRLSRRDVASLLVGNGLLHLRVKTDAVDSTEHVLDEAGPTSSPDRFERLGDFPQARVDKGIRANPLPHPPTYLVFSLPFTVWVLTSFFQGMPRELEEAAYIDGANPFQTFYKIMLPLAAPGMVTTGLLALIAAWNEFLYAVSFEFSPNHFTVPLGIFNLTQGVSSSYQIPWGNIMAATIVVTVPLVVLVLIFQRRIIAGMTAGAVKG
jgi:Binding-protein-dependent transport system inner membrane component